MSRRLALLIVAILTLSCSRSSSPPSTPAVAPSPGYADFSGLWSGDYRITECTGERDCVFRVGTTRPYVLRLVQTGPSVAGVLEAWAFAADVSGEISGDGSLTLTGSRPGTSGPEGIGAVRVTRFTLRLDPQQGLAGTIAYSVDPSVAATNYGMGVVSHTGVVVGSTRGTLPAASPVALASYEGTWTGTYTIDACTFTGWADCYPEMAGGAYNLTLVLRVDAGALAGELTIGSATIPVVASVTSSGLALRGANSVVVSGGRSVAEVVQWTTVRDAYARLNGTFEYDRRFLKTGGEPNTSHYRARLMGVTLRP